MSTTAPLQAVAACEKPDNCRDFKRRQFVQAKLLVGARNDFLEQEADRVTHLATRAATHSERGALALRIRPLTEKPVASMGTTAPDTVSLALAAPAQPLEPALRQDMEQRFGHDFSKVRVHAGPGVDKSARDIHARAYTVGPHIVFAQGQFRPETPEGQRLLAHELTHVVQQSKAQGAMDGPDHESHLRPSTAQQNTSGTVYALVQRQPDGDESGPTFGNMPRSAPTPGAGRVELIKVGDRWYEFATWRSPARRRASGTYNFVVQEGRLWAVRPSGPFGFGHTEAALGGRVSWAGQIRFGSGRAGRGILREWSNASGHYLPLRQFAGNAGLPMEFFRPHAYRVEDIEHGPQLPVVQSQRRPVEAESAASTPQSSGSPTQPSVGRPDDAGHTRTEGAAATIVHPAESTTAQPSVRILPPPIVVHDTATEAAGSTAAQHEISLSVEQTGQERMDSPAGGAESVRSPPRAVGVRRARGRAGRPRVAGRSTARAVHRVLSERTVGRARSRTSSGEMALLALHEWQVTSLEQAEHRRAEAELQRRMPTIERWRREGEWVLVYLVMDAPRQVDALRGVSGFTEPGQIQRFHNLTLVHVEAPEGIDPEEVESYAQSASTPAISAERTRGPQVAPTRPRAGRVFRTYPYRMFDPILPLAQPEFGTPRASEDIVQAPTLQSESTLLAQTTAGEDLIERTVRLVNLYREFQLLDNRTGEQALALAREMRTLMQMHDSGQTDSLRECLTALGVSQQQTANIMSLIGW